MILHLLACTSGLALMESGTYAVIGGADTATDTATDTGTSAEEVSFERWSRSLVVGDERFVVVGLHERIWPRGCSQLVSNTSIELAMLYPADVAIAGVEIRDAALASSCTGGLVLLPIRSALFDDFDGSCARMVDCVTLE